MDTDVDQAIPNPPDVEIRAPVCRLCLAGGEEEQLLEGGVLGGDHLQQWISDYLSIQQINQNDGRCSQLVCGRCRTRLKRFRDFHQRSTEVQNELLASGSSVELNSGDAIKTEPDLQQVCRLCLSRESLEDVFSCGELHRWISDYLSIAVSNEDSKSRLCCTTCKIHLEEFHNFRLRCLEVQTTTPKVVKNEPDDQQDTEISLLIPAENHGERSIQCKVCQKVIKATLSKRLEANFRSHMVRHGPKKHACTICDKAFVQRSILNYHMKVHFKGVEEPLVECDVCHKLLKNMSSLRVHKAAHGPTKFVCPTCGKGFAARLNYKQHLRYHNIVSESLAEVEQHSDHPFRCDVCFIICKNRLTLLYHKKIHQPKRKVCSICSKAFVRSQDLKDHLATHSASNGTEDGESRPFKCNICSKAYKRRSSLHQHKTAHAADKYVCSLCNKEFAEKQRLTAHMKIHDKRAERCEDVPDEDLIDILSGDPFECESCPKIYHTELELYQHTYIVHKYRKTSWASDSTDQSAAFGSSFHTQKSDGDGDNPFRCTVCRKAFKKKALLMDHLRKVRSKMSYKCTICRGRFGSRALLNKHFKDAIHAEGSNRTNSKSEAPSSAEAIDLFEAEDIKVEIQSDNDDD